MQRQTSCAMPRGREETVADTEEEDADLQQELTNKNNTNKQNNNIKENDNSEIDTHSKASGTTTSNNIPTSLQKTGVSNNAG